MFPTTSDIINKDLEKRSNKNKIAVLEQDFDPNTFQMPPISEDRTAVILDYNKKNDKVKVEIEKIGNNKEQFFKMKLGIFEMPDVKNSKDRAWKAKMRKATSTFGLLGALNEGLEKMKNESSESQD